MIPDMHQSRRRELYAEWANAPEGERLQMFVNTIIQLESEIGPLVELLDDIKLDLYDGKWSKGKCEHCFKVVGDDEQLRGSWGFKDYQLICPVCYKAEEAERNDDGDRGDGHCVWLESGARVRLAPGQEVTPEFEEGIAELEKRMAEGRRERDKLKWLHGLLEEK